MIKEKVLFVCVHNSARSQMAAALLNQLCPEHFEADSAGLEPGKLNLLAVEAMADIGIDISKNEPTSVFELFKQGRVYQYVIAVCDKKAAEQCPIFPMIRERLHWSFPDPSSLSGSPAEKIQKTIEIRNQIRKKILDWCQPHCEIKQIAS